MAITAKFIADFSQFSKEVTEMEKKLVQFEATTTTTSQAIVGMSTATTTTAPKVATLGQTFRQFDGILGAMGLSVGPVTGFVTDIGGLAAGSAVGMGALGTAALFAGTAIGTFMLTRGLLSKFFPELDGWIANTTAKWWGLGDVAAQTAGAINDVLAKASGIAGKAITDIEQARAIIQKWADENKKAAQDHADALKAQAEAMDTVLVAEQDHARVLAAMNVTTVAAAKDALELGVAQNVVATAYGLTASQIAAVVAALAAEKAEAKLVAAEQKRVTDDINKHYEAVKAVRDKAFGVDAINQAKLLAEAYGFLGFDIKTLSKDALAELNTTMLTAIDALKRTGQGASDAAGAFKAWADAAAAALKPVQDLVAEQWEFVTAMDAALAATIKQRDEAKKTADEAAATAKSAKAAGSAGAGVGLGMATTTGGVGVDQYGRPTINAFSGVGLGHVTTVNIYGSVLSNEELIARQVGGAISDTYRRGGNRVPV